eukprot:30233-Pelagococcus_subviridis.AAC.9
MPFGGTAPMRAIASGNFSLHSTASLMRCLTSSKPPTSSHPTFGTSICTSRIADGRIFVRASRKSASVMCSGASMGTPSSSRLARSKSDVNAPTASPSAFSRLHASIAATHRAHPHDARFFLSSAANAFSNISFPNSFSIPSFSFTRRRSAFIAAACTSAATSAPTNPCVFFESSSAAASDNSCFTVFKCASRISRRCFGAGTPTSISRSNRPGRRSARSIASGRFDVAMTITLSMST